MPASKQTPALFGMDRAAPRRKVLIVEDNRLDMILFSAILASQGYEVLEAVNASEGLDLARERRPDLIIMDVRLPDISGFEATRILKEDDSTRHIPIVVTSAYGPYTDQDKLRECGCDGYMPTPVEISAFMDLIHSFMAPDGARQGTGTEG